MSHRFIHLFLLFGVASLFVACSGYTVLPEAGAPSGPLPDTDTTFPEDHFSKAALAADLRFLASDELMGRKAGTVGNNVAARYIAEQFRAAGVQQVEGAEDYFQPIPFTRTTPPAKGKLALRDTTYRQGEALLLLAGEGSFEASAPVVFAGFGYEDTDYEGIDAQGKIVVTRAGSPADQGVQGAFRAIDQKRRLAAKQGAVAVIELYNNTFPWRDLVSVLGTPRFGLETPDPDTSSLPLAWLDDTDGMFRPRLQDAGTMKARLVSSGMYREPAVSNNVVGMIEGSDPDLRDEFVVLMAHYDHIGAGMRNGPGATPADSIFNGARDNGMGVVAVMSAAQALAEEPPRRSVLLLTLTAEEGGLLGSRYYVENPLLPLDQMVFALNIDGGGYSDITIATVIGLGRTTADPLIQEGAEAYGLGVIPDPAPEQGLFDRSDNVNFARKGIPAPTFSPGFRSFSDQGVANYYHRPQDEADDDFDYAYLKRFVQAYTHVARLIANADERPRWQPHDKYAEAARGLYGE